MKTIKVSDETYEKIKDQLKEDSSVKVYTKEDLIELLKTDVITV